jgi:2-hydroxychromene-2-carboxylate isomerase
MARTLEFYFDYGSPYSYLADTQVEAIASAPARRWRASRCCWAACSSRPATPRP